MKHIRNFLIWIALASCSQAQPTPPQPEVPTGYLYTVESAIPGKTVYICGQRPFDGQGNVVGANDLGVQARQVFENVKTSLATVNMSLTNISQIKYSIKEAATTSQVSAAKLQVVKTVEANYFTQAPSLIEAKGVSQTVRDDVLIEVEVVAIK